MPVFLFLAKNFVHLKKLLLLCVGEVVDAGLFAQKVHQLDVGELGIQLCHLLAGHIQDDALVAGVVLFRRAGHVDHVTVDQDQIAFARQKGAVVEKELPLPFQDEKDLVFVVKMAHRHIVLSVAHHMFHRNAVHRGAVGHKSNFFHTILLCRSSVALA